MNSHLPALASVPIRKCEILISHELPSARFGGLSNQGEKRCPLRFSCVKFNRSKAVSFAALE